MQNAHTRRQAALAAIALVEKGQIAGDTESEIVDFKEEAGTVDRSGLRRAIDPRDEKAALSLAEEAACMANSENGGVLIIGVSDGHSGRDAFVGAHLDTSWLRDRIYAHTTPGLAVDEPEERKVCGSRIYLINIPPALEEVRCQGKLRARFGTKCVELSGDTAREFLERRRNFDWSSSPSEFHASDCSAEALASAHRHYRDQHESTAPSDLALLRRLGVAIGDDEDPALSRAGALLLCESKDDGGGLDVQFKASEGAVSTDRLELRAPLVLAFDEAWEALTEALPVSVELVGAQRRRLRPLPPVAIRESLVNAIAHRDYRLIRGATHIVLVEDPPRVLKVTSPGTLPPGVSLDRLIATPSRPRNPTLATALRSLGLGEGEGVGIDRMYGSMLREGHEPPEISEAGGDVSVRLAGGRPDAVILRLHERILSANSSLADDVRTAIAIAMLQTETPLRPERLSTKAQCTIAEAMDALVALEAIGILSRVANRARSFALAPETRSELGARVGYQPRRALDSHWELIEAHLDAQPAIGRGEAAELLGVSPGRASQILRRLTERGDIAPVANSRGRGVRYSRHG